MPDLCFLSDRTYSKPTPRISVFGLQADMHHVAMPQLEGNVRVAFRQRGVSVHPSLSIRSEIEADSHFIKEQGPNGGDLMVRDSFSYRS